MSFRSAIVVAMLAALVIAGYLILAKRSGESTPPTGPGIRSALDDQEVGSRTTKREGLTESVESAISSSTAGKKTATESLNPTGIVISGTVRNKATAEPVNAFDFHLVRLAGDGAVTDDVVKETVRDDEGQFCFPLQRGGRHSLFVSSSAHCPARLVGLDISAESGLTDLEVTLDPGRSVSGRVVADATGRGIDRALVLGGSITTILGDEMEGLWLFGDEETCPHAWTDEEGRFNLKGLPESNPHIAAFHSQYAGTWIPAKPERDDRIEIRLEQGLRFYGKTFDDRGHPCAGVKVQVQDSTCLPVLSGPDGSYRTPPSKPGRQTLWAGPPLRLRAVSLNFTEERTVKNLVDCDVEVNFGPSPDHVTWRGMLLENSEAVAGGTISVQSDWNYDWDFEVARFSRSRTCDGSGRFEFHKLLPGRDVVSVDFPEGPRSYRWGRVFLATPGVIEKDIGVTGSPVSGVVIDGATGDPLKGCRGRIIGSRPSPEIKSFHAEVSADGCFRFRGIPPGTINLIAEIEGHPIPSGSQIEVPPAGEVDDVRVVIPTGGTLSVRLEGFVDYRLNSALLSLKHADGSWRPAGEIRCRESGPSNGTAEQEFALKTGDWTAFLSFGGEAMIEREFKIRPRETTGLMIPFSGLNLREGSFKVEGSLKSADGTPLAGAKLMILTVGPADWYDRSERRRDKTTGPDGRFVLESVKPGELRIEAIIGEGRRVRLPRLIVATGSADPIRYDVILHAGVVTGFLRDRRSGRPLSAEGPRWNVVLSKVDPYTRTSRAVSEQHTRGCLFRLEGVQAGEYQLSVRADGYFPCAGKRVILSEGQFLDLGDIALDPCGVLDLDVVDQDGQRIKGFDAVIQGSVSESYDRRHLSGMVRYTNLPVGEVEVQVGAPGFRSQEIRVSLEPAEPVRQRVMLERR